VGGPRSCEAGAMTDDMGDSLGVGTAFRAAGGFARMEAGCVSADEGVARDESDYCRVQRSAVRLARHTVF
jgi:hypothetical protein